MGIDRIFVDEADLYKNLGFTTKMTRVAGLPNSNSNRAADMHIKTRYLRKQNDGKGVVFATGTPISNTMAELYTMQRYLAPEALQAAGMAQFDAWAANFGETVTALELAPSGSGYRMHTRFAKFVNLPELLTMFRDFADVQTSEMLDLPRPALETGKNRIITAPTTPALKVFVQGLLERADKIKTGRVDPSDDNMLKVTGDGRKAALDMRLVMPHFGDHPQSKTNLVTNEIFAVWKETEAKRSTQLAFCDISTPNKDRFHVYGAIRSALIERGVPPRKSPSSMTPIRTPQRKPCSRRSIAGGSVSFLAQPRKWEPGRMCSASSMPRTISTPRGGPVTSSSAMAVSCGRATRTRRCVYIGMSPKARLMPICGRRLKPRRRFIQQVMNGDTSVRVAEDINGGALTYAEIKAIASGNPAVMEKVKVDTEIRKLDLLRTSHGKRQFEMRQKIGQTQTMLVASNEQLEKVRRI